MTNAGSIIVAAMIVGGVEFVKRCFDRDYRAAVIILIAVAIGALCGFFHVEGITIVDGIMLGFAGSGFVTSFQKIGDYKKN